MKRRDFLYLIIGFLSTCLLITIMFIFLSYSKKEEIKFNKAPEGLTIMIFDEDINDYIESEGIPIGGYKLNSEKSYCTNGGMIESYDNKNGKVNYSVDGSDECFVYLDVAQQIYLADNGYTFSWDAIPNAVSYNVYSDGELLLNTTNTEEELYLLYDESGVYNITVKAVISTGEEIEYENSINYNIEAIDESYDSYIYIESGWGAATGECVSAVIPDFDYLIVLDYNKYITLDGVYSPFEYINMPSYDFCNKNPEYCLKQQKENTIYLSTYSVNPGGFDENAMYIKIDTNEICYLIENSCNIYIMYVKKGKIRSEWINIEQYTLNNVAPPF